MRIAFITDWMTAPGGADRLLMQLIERYPESEIFTSIYNPEKYPEHFRPNVKVNESFIANLPFARKHHRHFNSLAPLAFESFDLDGYDMVVSLSAGPAKGIISGIDQRHIAIILTPPRSLWDKESNIRGARGRSIYKVLTPPIATYLRTWDQSAIKRSDQLISISKYIQKKVKKVYRKNSDVVYPGIPEFWFGVDEEYENELGEYFLVVSRLYDYKRVDWAIKASKSTKKKLVIVGEGPDLEYLRGLSNENVLFLNWVSDRRLRSLYRHAQGLLFCGVEDFGYVPIEAMASGCPVLAYNEGGVTETVQDGVSGEFFNSITELKSKISNHKRSRYDESEVKSSAEKFKSEKFINKISKIIEKNHEV